MNALDILEFTDKEVPEPISAQSTASSSNAPVQHEPTLNEEVSQVIGQLGRFWGGFRRQSQTVFEAARKDLGQAVVQAREELGKLASVESSSTIRPTTSQDSVSSSQDTSSPREFTAEDKGKAKEVTPSSDADAQLESPTSQTFTTFFSRLQSTLPPTLTPAASSLSQILQRNLSATIPSDLSHIRESVISNIQKVQQGITISQAEKLAEEYIHRSEALLKDAGTFLKDVVKVVPPEEGASHDDLGTAAIWDGGDVWLFPSPVGTAGWGGSAETKKARKEKQRTVVPSSSSGTLRISRRDALLKRLKYDPEMLRLDPTKDELIQERFLKFVKDEWEAKGGMRGEYWGKQISDALVRSSADEDADALDKTKEALVHSEEMTEETFWIRYFFRVDQIEQEEELRKAVLEGTIQREEEFSWEDEEEESSFKPHDTNGSTTTLIPKPTDMTPTQTATSGTAGLQVRSGPSTTNTSPRLSSEDSFDVIGSETSLNTGGSDIGGSRVKKEESEEDSDWD